METPVVEEPVVLKRTVMDATSWLDETTLPEDLIADAVEFSVLWDLHPPQPHLIKQPFTGKLIPTPRFQQAYLRTYTFSGTESVALPLPELFAPYLAWANKLGYGEFNAVLVNWYADGENYIGAHADDERQLIKESPVVTITLCQPSESEKKMGLVSKLALRKFRIRDKKTKEIVKDVMTDNGSVLIMGGQFQKNFTHEIVKITGKAAALVGPRISITLRQFKEDDKKKEKKKEKEMDLCALCSSRALYKEDDEYGLAFCDTKCQSAFHEVLFHNV